MKAIILAGGFGTRLRPLTINMPKPMVPMVNVPVMERVLHLLKKYDFTDILTILYYQPDVIRNYFGDGSRWGVTMTHVHTVNDYGTAGAVRMALDSLDEPVLVISADIVTDFDLQHLIEFHRQKRSMATLNLTRVTQPLEYGIVITRPDGYIDRFLEKPMWGEVFSDTVNTGIYVLEPAVLKQIPPDTKYDFSRDLFPKLLAAGMAFYGHIAQGYWKDIGNIKEYVSANFDCLEGRVQVLPALPQTCAGEVHPSATLSGKVCIAAGARIGQHCQIINSVLGPGCVIEDNALVSNSILWRNVVIGQGSIVREAVLGEGVQCGFKVVVDAGAVIGDHTQLGSNVYVKPYVKIWPNKRIEDEATVVQSIIWNERLARRLFSSFGVSGVGNIDITPEFAGKLGAAYGAFLGPGKQVVVSRDSHRASRMIHRAIISGLISAGVNVVHPGDNPAAVTRHMVRALSCAGGIHVRKSPYEVSVIDIKFFDAGGVDLAVAKEKTIESYYFSEDFARISTEEVGSITQTSQPLIQQYQDTLLQTVDCELIRRAHLKVVVDYSWGSASLIFPAILGKLGLEVVSLNSNIDENKISKTASDFQLGIDQLSTIVRTLQANVGILIDTGAEKIFVVDETGRLLSGDEALAFMVWARSKQQPGKPIAVPVSAPSTIEALALHEDCPVKRLRTHPRYLMQAAQAQPGIFIGEQSGGYIFSEVSPVFDGMLSVLRLLETLARFPGGIHQRVAQLPARAVQRKRIPCTWDQKGRVMRGLLEIKHGGQIELLDGIRITHNDSQVLVLPDADSPFFYIQAEAAETAEAEALVAEYSGKVLALRDSA